MTVLRAVLFADTHLGFDLPANPRVQRRRRGDDFFANFDRVVDHVLATRPALAIHGGDFFFRSRVGPGIVERAYTSLRRIAEAGIPVVIAPGNHERSKLPPSLWLRHANVHVFERPQTFVLDTAAGPVAVGGFPFLRGDLRTGFPEALAESGLTESPAELKLLVMHQTVAGSKVGPNGFTFRAGRDVIPREALPNGLAAVLAGHIHRAQVLGGPGGDGPAVVYPGSTERTSFAERNEPKGFYDLTFEPGPDGYWGLSAAQFNELPARPMVDVAVPALCTAGSVASFFRGLIPDLPGDAVVRITGPKDAGEATLRLLTAGLLRSIFPPTMNVQLAISMYASRERRPDGRALAGQ